MAGSYQREHLKSLTGLRFVAALSVFVAHSQNRWPVFDHGQLPFGAAGVSFFFLLSGFILTYVYGLQLRRPNEFGDDSPRASFSYKKFYIRRLARIWPIHVVTLLVSLFLVIGTEFFFRKEDSVLVLMSSLFLVQSWIPDYRWIYALNGPSWSLAVEAFFYLVFPLMLLGGAKRFAIKYVLIIVATVVSVVLLDQLELPDVNRILHTNPAMRLFEFATGVACGFWFLGRVASSQGNKRFGTVGELLTLGLVAAFFAGAQWCNLYDTDRTDIPITILYWFRFGGAAPVFAVVVIVFSCSNGVISKLLSNRVLVYLGEISYSFYMIHMPVMVLMMRYVWVDTPDASLAISVGCLAISIFFAALLYHLVEMPFRKSIVGFSEGAGVVIFFKEFFGSLFSWLRSPSFAITLAFAAVGFWLATSNLFDIRSESLANAIVASSPESLRGVEFETDATLLGVEVKEGQDGSMELKFVWQLHEGRRAMRLIKLLGDDGKVLAQANQNRTLFDVVLGEATVIDWVKIEPSKMEGVRTIAVSFFEKERRLAKIDRGPRSLSNRQLNVWVRRVEADSRSQMTLGE